MLPIEQYAGWASGPFWTAMERRKFLAASGFRNLDHPALSELLHPLRHAGTLANVPNLAIYFVARHSKI